MLLFMATENYICNLLALQAAGILTDLCTRYGVNVPYVIRVSSVRVMLRCVQQQYRRGKVQDGLYGEE